MLWFVESTPSTEDYANRLRIRLIVSYSVLLYELYVTNACKVSVSVYVWPIKAKVNREQRSFCVLYFKEPKS